MNNERYEVRFHLGRGAHFKHWQVKTYIGSRKVATTFYDPDIFSLQMFDCSLYNNRRVAQKVKNSGSKDVCGWIKCKRVDVLKGDFMWEDYRSLERLYYNPINDIHWRRDGDDGTFNWDNSEYDSLITWNKNVYILSESDIGSLVA